MKDLALVTIAIPTFNNIKFFRQALNSVMNQTYSNIEILIIDDGADNTIERYLTSLDINRPIRYIKNKINLGFKKNFDKCWEYASGLYVMILHQDDILLPNLVERYVEIFSSREKVGAVCCKSLRLNGENIIERKGKNDVSKEFEVKTFLQEFFLKGHPEIATLMVKSNLVKDQNKLHFHHESNPYYDDYYFWIDLAFETNIYFLCDELFIRRIHSNQTSKVMRKMKDDFFIEVCHYIRWVIDKTLTVIDEEQRKFLYNWAFNKLYHDYLLYYKRSNKEHLMIMEKFIKEALVDNRYLEKKERLLLVLSKIPYPLNLFTFKIAKNTKKIISKIKYN